jgi:hypothetical protein
MTEHETSIINQFAENRAEVVGASRFFNNERTSQEALISATRAVCESKCEGRHVLAIQDTTELNYADHDRQLKASDPELGPVGNDEDVGFFFHPTLALDAESGLPLGFADAHLWNRRWGKKDKHERNYAQQPIEEKESYRWIQSSRQAKRTLREADRITIIADREGDIYEELVEVPDEQTDVLIRSRSDRRLAEASETAASETAASETAASETAASETAASETAASETMAHTLYEYLEERPSEGSYELEVTGNNGRQRRTARLEVRFGPVEVRKPSSNHHAESLPESVRLCAVEAREKPDTVPEREDPIRWRLLTSRSVETFEQAREAIADYGKRPRIEQSFACSKARDFGSSGASSNAGRR